MSSVEKVGDFLETCSSTKENGGQSPRSMIPAAHPAPKSESASMASY